MFPGHLAWGLLLFFDKPASPRVTAWLIHEHRESGGNSLQDQPGCFFAARRRIPGRQLGMD
jgi:hypothetical protein